MGVTFTKEQQQVIDLRNRNILVSAAAGSGKTAVLVERIIARLTRDVTPIDVDQLLVVTYTEAAAAEMKERIHRAIEKALENRPEDMHLQRQATLIHNAQVTTIHSFCLSVIRDYFHTIDLDPGFRIGEEGELKLLKRDVLEEVLEKWYAEGSEAFLTFVESFATGKDDRKLEEIVTQLYDYSRSYPNPDTWLEASVEKYHIEREEALEEATFVKTILRGAKNTLEDIETRIHFALELCKETDGPVAYKSALESDLKTLTDLLEAESFHALQKAISSIKWTRLGTNKKNVSEGMVNLVKNTRNEYKEIIKSLKEHFFFDTTFELQKGMLAAESNMKVLIALVKEFAAAFLQKKQSRNMIDFSDMEHYALQILTSEENGILVPSAVAKEYQEKYAEVMIDEYQDSNYIQEAILTSVSTVSKGINNVFMVGDVKQSIYRFRLSRPELFMEKYDTYDTEESDKQRIDLHKNFRSRKEVLDSTNFIFKQIMMKDFGGIEYDDQAALYVGAEYQDMPGNETELCLISVGNIEEKEAVREVEARAIARKIKNMVRSHLVYDKQSDSYRKAGYGDFVILTRTIKGWAEVFLKVFSQEGIPAYSVSKEGYFETREIQLLLNYLKVLDNPRQDIPFAAVLTEPFVNITSEELAVIQGEMSGKTFYEKTCSYVKEGTKDFLRERLAAFLAQLEAFRQKIPYMAIHELLYLIMEKTGYGNYMASLVGGEQRAANLEMLVEKAISFESTSYKGLFHFVRYIEQLYKYEVDYGEASIVDEAADVVRIMSIHKSKGLEFPIVFVAGMSKGFNLQDARSSVVIHPEIGVGINYIDIEKRTKYPSLLKRMIQDEVTKETVAEELRVLYVAMTRAREKLILVGTVSDLNIQLSKYSELSRREEMKLPYLRVTTARTYLDWILPALYRNKAFAPVLEEYGISGTEENDLFGAAVPFVVEKTNLQEFVLDEMEEEYEDFVTKQTLSEWDTEMIYDHDVKQQIETQFSYVYPYTIEQKSKQKISVSELKKKVYMEETEMEEEEVIPLLPKFLQEESGMTGASRGTAYHKFLELLDLSLEYDTDSLKKRLSDFVTQKKMTKDAAQSIRYADILAFLHSPVGTRIRKASQSGKLHTEQPFILAMKPEDVDTVLIQGIIDVYFEEEDELVVLDYKTDRVNEEQELVDRYQIQLQYYAEALERLTGKKVKEKVIYSFALRKEISLKNE